MPSAPLHTLSPFGESRPRGQRRARLSCPTRAVPSAFAHPTGPRLPLLLLLRLGGCDRGADDLLARRVPPAHLANQTFIDALAIRDFIETQALGVGRAGLPLLQRLGGRAQRGGRRHDGECEYDAVKHKSSLRVKL